MASASWMNYCDHMSPSISQLYGNMDNVRRGLWRMGRQIHLRKSNMKG